jgi:hypothetical protein
MSKYLSFSYVLVFILMTGCAASTPEVITCYPPQADIYWGESPDNLKKTGFTTPHSRSISGAEREDWCYQVKKEGYKESDIICRKEEAYRYLDFSLVPLKTTITSEPSGAVIYWGPSKDQLEEAKRVTPHTVTAKDVWKGASWKDWCYQVKKERYLPSEIACLPQQSADRMVNFELKSVAGGAVPLSSTMSRALREAPSGERAISDSQVTLTWEDASSNELGFKIERKKGPGGIYQEIATVGANVITYIDTKLTPNTIYYYRVRAYNSRGYSAYCDEKRIKTSPR